ncbi:hypothetical protein CISG_07424 [Coccidioides immitis RMSCC 3703]|uniref:Uncharacterized protein n=1 Tax=Coccidioides immitis RMSCC 3703 TaxID=454286 RepID=A0A0J8TY64_COCIT|nr:hypothetical protein CISG_07424 [Coccidioides immitis RMSCC 3703]
MSILQALLPVKTPLLRQCEDRLKIFCRGIRLALAASSMSQVIFIPVQVASSDHDSRNVSSKVLKAAKSFEETDTPPGCSPSRATLRAALRCDGSFDGGAVKVVGAVEPATRLPAR